MCLLTVENNGQEITRTNYWNSKNALSGGFRYLSCNAGAARLLVPDSQIAVVDEMRASKHVILSRGPWVPEDGCDATEILFEEDADNHFAVTVPAHQTDGSLLENHQGGGIVCVVWTRAGKQLQLHAYYREVESLPCYQSWAVH